MSRLHLNDDQDTIVSRRQEQASKWTTFVAKQVLLNRHHGHGHAPTPL